VQQQVSLDVAGINKNLKIKHPRPTRKLSFQLSAFSDSLGFIENGINKLNIDLLHSITLTLGVFALPHPTNR